MAADNALNFMGYRKIMGLVSTVLILISMVSLSVRQLELGLDFTGRTLIEVGYSDTVNLNQVRGLLAEPVTPEYGAMQGIVTIEDVLKTLIGHEIVDEGDSTVNMQKLARQLAKRRRKVLGLKKV